ncbi:NusA antitermination factor [Fusobacterium naviforme]|uniref:Transcription termination/antitermination protein NusA n=1 Tax=Moryella indoligenes TaxID=371674 RepID=A0AAE4ALY0_9FIRM|nr:transcription termination factor NusA [Moryella indoligenes]KAB0577846.1 transcription termination/antitermination protein NusA [Fusobacterium naviforme]MDQ0152576.1 N utilization substance protein A [Moryella indoligenes]PSL10638.1 NusA antitermination factor [Fusobacterium naviforme]STO27187.1 Transcription elongation protein nusA [Fusobacterium naviforme]
MRKTTKEPVESGNELKEAIELLEREKNISKDSLLDAIQNSLLSACKNSYGTADNVDILMDRDSCKYRVMQKKTVVEEMPEKPSAEEKATMISLAEAKMIDAKYEAGDIVPIEIKSREFGRIATGIAKNVILQKIREEERKVIYNDYFEKEKDIITGIVQRHVGNNLSISLGRCDTLLTESEQVKGEEFNPTDRIKLYVVEVKDTPRGPKITVSRSHPELVKRLFEQEVTEVRDGTVEIRAIAREAGSRTKMAVWSNDPNVDPVGACVGMNGARVNAVVDELRGEKIDIINWDENPAYLIENALSPAKVILVMADEEGREAQVIVPDYQLSLAIGKEGQNARLAAKLTGFKIDIKSETQAQESGLFDELGIDYQTEGSTEIEGELYSEESGPTEPEGE